MRIADAFVLLDILHKFGTVGFRYPKDFLVGGLVGISRHSSIGKAPATSSVIRMHTPSGSSFSFAKERLYRDSDPVLFGIGAMQLKSDFVRKRSGGAAQRRH